MQMLAATRGHCYSKIVIPSRVRNSIVTSNIDSSVTLMQAEVSIDEDQFRAAYIHKCDIKAAEIHGAPHLYDLDFTATINGEPRKAYIMYEASSWLGSRVICRYLFDKDENGEWYDLFVIDLRGRYLNPRQKIRGSGSQLDGLFIHFDADQIIRQY